MNRIWDPLEGDGNPSNRPRAEDPTASRYSYIRAKYQDRAFLRTPCNWEDFLASDVVVEKKEGGEEAEGAGEEASHVRGESSSDAHLDKSQSAQAVLVRALKCDDIALALAAIAYGAQVNGSSATEWNSTTSPLHVAAATGSLCSCTLLILNGADLFALDSAGRDAATVADLEGHANLASYLKRKANLLQVQKLTTILPVEDLVNAVDAMSYSSSSASSDSGLNFDAGIGVGKGATLRGAGEKLVDAVGSSGAMGGRWMRSLSGSAEPPPNDTAALPQEKATTSHNKRSSNLFGFLRYDQHHDSAQQNNEQKSPQASGSLMKGSNIFRL